MLLCRDSSSEKKVLAFKTNLILPNQPGTFWTYIGFSFHLTLTHLDSRCDFIHPPPPTRAKLESPNSSTRQHRVHVNGSRKRHSHVNNAGSDTRIGFRNNRQSHDHRDSCRGSRSPDPLHCQPAIGPPRAARVEAENPACWSYHRSFPSSGELLFNVAVSSIRRRGGRGVRANKEKPKRFTPKHRHAPHA